MTITEKILAKHSGRSRVEPGETIWVDVDFLMTHDVCGPGTIGIFHKHFGKDARVWNREKVVLIPDHYIFTQDPHAQRNLKILRRFAQEQKLPYFYDAGSEAYRGVCHVALAEEGFTVPGSILFGTDSHTCTAGAFGMFATGIGNTDAGFILGTGKLWVKVPATMRFILEGELPPYVMAKDVILKIISDIGVDGATYRTMEFTGDGVHDMNMEERMTLCNMVIEAGSKNGIVAADKTTVDFIHTRTDRSFDIITNDPDARFYSTASYKASLIEPQVAKPFSPENVELARNLQNIHLDQCYIGSCTGGKITDFIACAKILKGRTLRVKTVLVPATTQVERTLEEEKLGDRCLKYILLDAGAEIGRPSCAACLGGPEDTFGRLSGEEVCLSTTNRNFPGRMGSSRSKTYLASPMTVAASAVTGRITDPREFIG